MDGYDVIGDVHGCADALEQLLGQMGYHVRGGVWRHPSRQAVFVGDLIDRGSRQVDTVTIVRSMVEAGAARATMGNHEFNAIAWMTEDPEQPGTWLRSRKGEPGQRHRHQHVEFLHQVGEDSAQHLEIVDWFRTLPMWLDLGGLRVAHACWHDDSLAVLPVVSPDTPISVDFMVRAHDRPPEGEEGGSAEYHAVETVLKGPEMPVPEPYFDKDGHPRTHARIRWWDRKAATMRQLAEIPPKSRGKGGGPYPPLPDVPSTAADAYRYDGDVPVAFGHYWRTEATPVVEPRAVCVDYSAVRRGHLAAYRWDGESTVDASKLVKVSTS